MAHVLAEVRAATWEALRDLQRVHDVDVFGATARALDGGGFAIQGLLTDEQAARLRGAGYTVDVLHDAGAVADDRLRELRASHARPGEDDESGAP